MRVEVRVAGSSMACKRSGAHASSAPPISGTLCPMRARGVDWDHRLAANLHVSRPTRSLAPAPSQGGSAGSNPVGATNHQHNTAADQQERGSAAVLRVRPSPARSGYGQSVLDYLWDATNSQETAEKPVDISTIRYNGENRSSASKPK